MPPYGEEGNIANPARQQIAQPFKRASLTSPTFRLRRTYIIDIPIGKHKRAYG